MKKRTVFTIIIAVLAIGLIAGGFYAVKMKEKKEKEPMEPESVYTLADKEYTALAQQMEQKLYESDVDGLFYSLSPVKYYLAKDGKLEALEPAGSIESSPVVAGTKMKFKLSFVKVGKELFGVGLWNSDSGIYNNAFAVLKNMPEALASGRYLLLIDTSSKDLSATERNYSEIFSLNKSGEVNGYVFDQRNRTVEESGKLRSDWDMMRLEMLHCSGERIFSLTGRKYNRDVTNQFYDLRLSNAQSIKTVASKVSEKMLQGNVNKFTFLRVQNNAWQVVESKAGKEKTVGSYEGDIEKDYILRSGIAIRKSDSTIIDLLTGEETVLSLPFKSVYSIAKKGSRTVCIGKEENRDGADFKVQKIVLITAQGEQKSIFANDIMDENSPLYLSGEGILTQKQGKSVFISYSALENLLLGVIK